MFKHTDTFSSYSVDDLTRTKVFYEDTLGVEVEAEEEMGIRLHIAKGSTVYIYPKEDHQPAGLAVLNFIVDDLDTTMDAMREQGVEFLYYENDDLPQDEKGVLRGLSAGIGPDIAWFEDPAGNVLSILQEK